MKRAAFYCRILAFALGLLIPAHAVYSADLNLDDLLYNNPLGKNSDEIVRCFELKTGTINADGWQGVGIFFFENEQFEVGVEMSQNKCVALSITKGQLRRSSNSRILFDKLARALNMRFGAAPLLDANKYIQQEDATETPSYTWVNDTQVLGLSYSICPYGNSIQLSIDDKAYSLEQSGSTGRELGNLATIYEKHSGKLPDNWVAARKTWKAIFDAGKKDVLSMESKEPVAGRDSTEMPSSVVVTDPKTKVSNLGASSLFRVLTFIAIGVLAMLLGGGLLF
jgi:hypothetical protein